MLISFIGAPCSGKTTVAAMFFASIKDAGQLAEFVPEQARLYIAKKKQTAFEQHCLAEAKINKGRDIKNHIFGGIAPWNFPVKLTDLDQIEIMKQQREADDLIYITAGPGTTIVTDSSPINSLFYMSKEIQKENANSSLIKNTCQHTRLFFYVKPILNSNTRDLLRIHDEKFSMEMDNKIIPSIIELCPDIITKVVPLIGSAEDRKIQALTIYYETKFPRG